MPRSADSRDTAAKTEGLRRFSTVLWMGKGSPGAATGFSPGWPPLYRDAERLDLRQPASVFHRIVPTRLSFWIRAYISVVVVVGAVDMWKSVVSAAHQPKF